jgi:hypothetical protein
MSPLLSPKPATESSLDRLEREANDDFRLLEELGPTQFGTEHLLELRDQIRRQLSVFDRRQRLAMLLGGTAAGWIFLGLVVGQMGWIWLAVLAHGIALLSFIGFAGILVFLKKRYESRGELEHTAREIETELRRRRVKKW